jgi:hypothetical protein
MLRTAGTLALATAALAAPTPAFANWESIHEATPPNADARDNKCRTVALRARDNRALRVATGAVTEIEVLGHGIDLRPDADFEFTGGRLTILRRYGGPENLIRECGAIGSVKLRLSVDRAYPEIGAPVARNYTLRIGDQRIPITALLPDRMIDFDWHFASYRMGDQPLSPNPFPEAGSGGNNATAPSSPPSRSSPPSSQGPILIDTGQSCPNGVCGGGGTSGFMVPRGPGAGSSDYEYEPFDSLKGCILGRGGDIRLVGRRLEIMLPDDRNAVRSCITKPVFATTGQFYDRDRLPDITPESSRQWPELRFSVRGGTGASAAASRDPDRAKFWLTEDFATSMIGVRNFQLVATNFASRTQILDVRVQSVVPYGVTRIAPATGLVQPASPSAPDLSARGPVRVVPTVSFDVELAATDVTARPLEWRLLNLQRDPLDSIDAQCFTATSGRLTPAAGTSRVTLNVERASAATCKGRQFLIDIAPQGQLQLDNWRYIQRTSFTLP